MTINKGDAIMSVKVTFQSEFINDLLTKTRRSAAAAGETPRSRMAAAAGDAIACAKLRRTIDELEDEIALQMCAIGELVYATHCGTPSDSDEMQKILEYLDDLHDEVEAHEREIKLIRGSCLCEVCGAENTAAAVCRSCGAPLSSGEDNNA